MQSPDKFKCKLCKNAYSYEGTLKTHVMIVHCKINSYFCNQCEYHKPDLNEIKAQTPKGASAQTDTLRGHLKTHSREKSHKCTQCDFATVWASRLKTHLKSHSGEKSHKCKQCRYAFIEASGLRRHLKTHTGEKSHKCNQCGYASIEAGKLRRHLKTHSEKTGLNVM